MGAQLYIRYDRLLHQIGLLAFASRIFVRSNVGVGPTVKSTRLDGCEVIWYQVITQSIALLDGRPESLRPWIPAQSDDVTNPCGHVLVPRAVRVVPVNGRPVRIFARVHV